MAGFTLEQAQQQLDMWLAASVDIATRGQSYAISGRELTRVNMMHVQNQIEFWRAEVTKLTLSAARRRGPRYGAPC